MEADSIKLVLLKNCLKINICLENFQIHSKASQYSFTLMFKISKIYTLKHRRYELSNKVVSMEMKPLQERSFNDILAEHEYWLLV